MSSRGSGRSFGVAQDRLQVGPYESFVTCSTGFRMTSTGDQKAVVRAGESRETMAHDEGGDAGGEAWLILIHWFENSRERERLRGGHREHPRLHARKAQSGFNISEIRSLRQRLMPIRLGNGNPGQHKARG